MGFFEDDEYDMENDEETAKPTIAPIQTPQGDSDEQKRKFVEEQKQQVPAQAQKVGDDANARRQSDVSATNAGGATEVKAPEKTSDPAARPPPMKM